MSSIRPTDPDFRICLLSFNELLEIQAEAENREWGTRWTSEAALRGQVKEGPVVLRSFMREERGNTVRAYRCLLLFAVAGRGGAGATATIDATPERFASLGRIDRDPDVRGALTLMFSIAVNGISMFSKELPVSGARSSEFIRRSTGPRSQLRLMPVPPGARVASSRQGR